MNIIITISIKNILSLCSPQVYDILTSKLCLNLPFVEFYAEGGETAYDKKTNSILLFYVIVINLDGVFSDQRTK